MRGHRRNQAEDLKAPMLALLAENGPAHSKGVLTELKRQGRVSRGVTMAHAYEACEALVREGRLERRGGGTLNFGHFRVPRDDRERWDT